MSSNKHPWERYAAWAATQVGLAYTEFGVREVSGSNIVGEIGLKLGFVSSIILIQKKRLLLSVRSKQGQLTVITDCTFKLKCT